MKLVCCLKARLISSSATAKRYTNIVHVHAHRHSHTNRVCFSEGCVCVCSRTMHNMQTRLRKHGVMCFVRFVQTQDCFIYGVRMIQSHLSHDVVLFRNIRAAFPVPSHLQPGRGRFAAIFCLLSLLCIAQIPSSARQSLRSSSPALGHCCFRRSWRTFGLVHVHAFQ